MAPTSARLAVMTRAPTPEVRVDNVLVKALLLNGEPRSAWISAPLTSREPVPSDSAPQDA